MQVSGCRISVSQAFSPCCLSLPGLQNPVDALYHLQPLMFIGLFPLFQYNEGECSVGVPSSSSPQVFNLYTATNSMSQRCSVRSVFRETAEGGICCSASERSFLFPNSDSGHCEIM